MINIQWIKKWGILLELLILGQGTLAQDKPLQSGETLPLSNANFEQGATQWTVQDPTAMSQVTAEAAHSGTMGLRISANGDKHGSNAFSSVLPATEGQGLRLSFWAKTQTPSVGAYLVFYDAKKRSIPDYSPATVLKKDADWTRYQLVARAPYGAASTKIWIHSFGGATVTADFDDFRLEAASGPEIADLSVPVPASAPDEMKVRKTPVYVMLKLDDLGQTKDRINPRWQKVMDFIKERNIKASFGIILNSLEGDTPNYVQWIKDQQATGLIEFWNHGYDHRQWDENGQTLQEFNGPSYEQQKDHFIRSEALFRAKLGFPIATFGAPYNSTDANTGKALAEVSDLKISLYGDSQNPGGKVVLHRTENMGIEDPLFSPSADKFIAAYNRFPNDAYFVIQGHPAQWDDTRFAQFVKIVDFLTEQKAIFTTPSEYVTLAKLSPIKPTP